MQDWLSARVAATPHKPALSGPAVGESLSWTQVQQRVFAACDRFQDVMLEPGDQVGLFMNNSADYVACVYAAMFMGITIVPLNGRLTAEEFVVLIDRIPKQRVFYDDDHFDVVQAAVNHSRRFIASKSLRIMRRGILKRPSAEVGLDKPFAIVHTSGTSGPPRGAVLTLGNFFYSAMASAARLGHQPDDVWLCTLPLYHVGGLSILMRALLYGITVDLHERFDLDKVNAALDSGRITIISLVPTMLYRLLDSRTTWPESLRLILLGGAGAAPELIERCRALNLPIATTYGLTEAASQVATALPEDVYRKPGSVGKPLLFTTVRIVNENNEPADVGEVGEILVSGPTVMHGYFNDPDATSATLLNNELHTGDIGYLDEDGDLFVLERRSDLIVSGGENVYPAEVEAVLKQHPQVKEAVVVGLPHAEWGQQVAAAVVLEPDAMIDGETLMAFCRQTIAGFKIPRRIIFAGTLPMTASGKIQRRAVTELFKDPS